MYFKKVANMENAYLSYVKNSLQTSIEKGNGFIINKTLNLLIIMFQNFYPKFSDELGSKT